MTQEMTSNDTDHVTPEIVSEDSGSRTERPTPDVSEPSKLIRIASMTRAMLEEVRDTPLDDAGKSRLVAIYEGSLEELKEVLSDDLVEELDSVFLPITEPAPSEGELRIVQAQLVGWLEGLFHGIQASLITQQMAASAQLETMRERKAIAGQRQPTEGGGLYL
jgi:hypothetical protein